MNFLSHNLPLVPDADSNVTGLLFKTIALTFGTRRETSSRCRLINVNDFDFQFVDISTIVMLGVRNRGLKRLLDDDRRPFSG